MAPARALTLGMMSLAMTAALTARIEAATATATMTVTATVAATCTVVGGTLVFPIYDVMSSSPTDGTLQLAASCTRGSEASIGLELGNHATGSTRRMSDPGSSHLVYELYKDSSHSVVWGTTGASVVDYVAASSAVSYFMVYGRISALQDVPQATYTDSVVVVITF